MPNNVTRYMMNAFRDFFLPTERNGLVPGALRAPAFGVYLFMAGCLIVAPRYLTLSELALLAKPAAYTGADMVALTNAARAAVGLPALTPNALLSTAAQKKLDDMLGDQYFAHVSPMTAKKPWDFFKDAGYRYAFAGENLAKDFLAPSAAQDAFMASPTHRANVLNPNYTEIGIAVGQGTFEGRTAIFVAEYFGKPLTTPKRAPVTPQVSSVPVAVQATSVPVVSSATPARIAPTTTVAVLGTESGSDVPTNDPLAAAARTVTENGWARSIALIAALIVLVPLIAFIVTIGRVAAHITVPATLVILLFVSIAVLGVRYVGPERITPQAIADTTTP